MSDAEPTAPPTLWAVRRTRVLSWLARAPHADELLTFYLAVLVEQEALARWAHDTETSAAPPSDRDRRFQAFVTALAAVAPDRLRSASASPAPVHAPPDATQGAGAVRPDGDATWTPHDPDPARAFFASAFLEPLMATAPREHAVRGIPGSMPEGGGPPGDAPPSARCPGCGAPPLVSLIKDAPEAQGARFLVCGSCTREWRWDRARCPGCGASGARAGVRHTAESVPHMVVSECGECRRYLKEVDRRVDGRAEPVVDDIATPELDLWAGERGFEKLRPNLLGI